MGKAICNNLWLNVLAIGGENRTPTDEPPRNGEQRLQIGIRTKPPEWRPRQRSAPSLSRKSERTEHEANEQTARIAQENRGGIEVEAKKSRMAPASVTLIREPSQEWLTMAQTEEDHRRKQGRSGG